MRNKFTLILFLHILLISMVVHGQKTVTGIVTDMKGEPLIGASVTEKNTTNGVFTDFEGLFEINVAEDAKLDVSYVGYTTKTINVAGKSELAITLKAGTQLKEVVVTALGISRERKALGYAVDEVNSEAIENSGQSNIISSLQGRSAGLQVFNTSGAPGAGSTITIRGVNSLDPNRNNRPLYVIDGIEVSDDVLVGTNLTSSSSFGLSTSSGTQTSTGNRIMDLNPNDIASVSILKGAGATALYGVRAANGVIIITTKKGQSGEPRINISYAHSWSNINKYPDVQKDFIDGHRSTSLKRGFLWDTWGVKVHDQTTTVPRNIYHSFYQTGMGDDITASISAGTEQLNYRVSAGYGHQNGIVPESYLNKGNIGLNLNAKPTDRLSLQMNFRYLNTQANTPSEGRKSIMNVLNYMTTVADVNSYTTPYTYGGNAFAGIIDHPLFLAQNITNESKVNRVLAGGQISYQLSPEWSLNYNLGLDNYSDSRERIVHPETDEGQSGVNGPPHGFMTINNFNVSALTSNAFLQYNTDLSPDFTLNFNVGQYTFVKSTNVQSIVGLQFEIDNFYNLNNTLELEQNNGNYQYRNAALYGDVTLGYRNYLYLNITGRNDWSSTLPQKNNSYFFPSMSVSWIASEVMDMNGVFDFLKLRASYAISAKDYEPYGIGRYYQLTNGFPFNGVNGFSSSTVIGDEDLRPEFAKGLELGIDARILQNRLGVELTYYNTQNTDMILPVPVSNTTGVSRIITNAGSISSNGFEANLNYDIIKRDNKSWNWSIGANFSKYIGKVVDISTGSDNNEIVLADVRNVVNKYVEGGRIGDLYGRPFERTADGRLILDNFGFPTLDVDSLVLMGSAVPDFIIGMTSEVSYRGWSFSILGEWKKGGKAVDVGRTYSVDNGQVEETNGRYQRVIFDGVTLDSDNNYVENEQPVEINAVSFYRDAQRARYAPEATLKRTDWFRIRTVSVSYTFSEELLNWEGIEEIKLSVIANNLYLSTPYVGFDPESNFFGASSNIQGYVGLRTPNVRSWTARVNLTF